MTYDRLFVWECKRCFSENVALVRGETEPGEVLQLTCEHCGSGHNEEYRLPTERTGEGLGK